MKNKQPFAQMQNTVYRKEKNIVSRAILDEIIIVPISGNLADMQCIFSTESVGAFIWDHIDGNNDLAVIYAQILGQFDVEPDRAVTDLLEFITELHDAGLIQAKAD